MNGTAPSAPDEEWDGVSLFTHCGWLPSHPRITPLPRCLHPISCLVDQARNRSRLQISTARHWRHHHLSSSLT